MHKFDRSPPAPAEPVGPVGPVGPGAASEGEASWVGALYRAHAPAIFAFLRQRAATRTDAEDILLDVFTAALEHPALAGYPPERQAAWLWRVARNKAADHHRRAARHPTLDLDHADDLTADAAGGLPEHDALRRDEYRLLHAHLWTLTPLQRDVLRLRFAEGMRSGEIARALGKQEAAVRALLARALRALRAAYAQQEGGSPHDA